MAVTRLGPGTITVGSTPVDFSAEVTDVTMTHGYNETAEAKTYLVGSTALASFTRSDGVTAALDNDLTAAGLYAYLQTNDLTEQPFSYTPQDADTVEWAGTVQVTLPEEIGTDAYGNPLASSVSWQAVGKLGFTPSGDTAPDGRRRP